MRFSALATGFLCFFLVACNFNFKVTDHQDFPVDVYDDPDANMELATNLLYATPEYIQANVPALKLLETTDAVKINSFRGSDDKVFLRVIYQKQLKSVAENFDDLQAQFDAFAPRYIQNQIDYKDQLEASLPAAEALALNVLLIDPAELYAMAAPLLHYYTAEKPFTDSVTTIQNYYGAITDLRFIRSLMVEPYGKIPGNVMVHYFEASTSSAHQMYVILSLLEVEGEWRMMGFNAQEKK